MSTPQQLHDRVLAAAAGCGFDWAGVAGVGPAPELAGFAAWMASGRAGEMHYLGRQDAEGRYLREAIGHAWPWARSVLCGAVVYNSLPPEAEHGGDGSRGWISRYAWGDDYHQVLRQRLECWAERLRETAGQPVRTALVVDTAPLAERAAAAQAGLGWQGKNTCLIHPQRGSFFFIGAILADLELPPDAPLPDRCGSCTRCIEACPTQALTPYQMDASRCLAYLNIELRGPIPEPLRTPMGDNVLGCDICQEVCPWNRRAPATADAAFQPRPGLLAPLLAELAALTEAEYRQRFRRSAVQRAKFAGLRRNVAIAMGNSGEPGHAAQLADWAESPDAVLAEAAAWALHRLRRESDMM